MAIIRVLAAVVSTTELTLYKEDGDTFTIPQGDPRVIEFINLVRPNAMKGLVTEIDLGQAENHYKDFEDANIGGVVKFFRVAKRWLSKAILGEDDVTVVPVAQPEIIGRITTTQHLADVAEHAGEETQMDRAIEDIMANSKSVQDPSFVEAKEEDTKDTTVVAVVETPTGKKIVPHMENLKDQFAHAAKLGTTTGVQKFIERLSAVIDKRGHSVKDLLEFMQKGDLPIADDGCIVAYKVLDLTSDKGVYVDCHTKKVRQQVGSYVHMKQELVDPSRRNDCSNGLHIARRDYVGQFTKHSANQTVVICKIPPENAIAVPEYGKSKIRVMGYHIVGLLPASAQELVKSNTVMTGTSEAAVLLHKVLRGEHIGIIEYVEITQQQGGGVKITPVEMTPKQKYDQQKLARKITHGDQKAEPVVTTEQKVRELNAPKVDPKEIAKSVVAEKKAGTPMTFRELYENRVWDKLWEKKLKAKKSWTALGFGPSEIVLITDNAPAIRLEPAKPTAEPKKKTPKPGQMTKAEVKKQEKTVSSMTPIVEAVSEADEVEATKKPKSRQEVARELFNLAIGGSKPSWTHLWLHKKKAKISWSDLGFTSKEEERIKTNKPDHV